MATAPVSPAEAFANAERTYIKPLVADLHLLAAGRHESLPAWLAQDWSARNVFVRLEYERGLISCAVASVAEADRFWEVELVAELFPRIRLMPGGVQRLTIEEQAQFLLKHMPDLQRLFAPENYPATRARLTNVHRSS